VPSILIRNLGAVVTGELSSPLADGDAVYIEDGVIREVGSDRGDAETIVDAGGLTLTPGLVDGHSHPGFGDFSPTQNSVGWMHAYLHAGVTTIISAGRAASAGSPAGSTGPQAVSLSRRTGAAVHCHVPTWRLEDRRRNNAADSRHERI
jgi:enamidase